MEPPVPPKKNCNIDTDIDIFLGAQEGVVTYYWIDINKYQYNIIIFYMESHGRPLAASLGSN